MKKIIIASSQFHIFKNFEYKKFWYENSLISLITCWLVISLWKCDLYLTQLNSRIFLCVILNIRSFRWSYYIVTWHCFWDAKQRTQEKRDKMNSVKLSKVYSSIIFLPIRGNLILVNKWISYSITDIATRKSKLFRVSMKRIDICLKDYLKWLLTESQKTESC